MRRILFKIMALGALMTFAVSGVAWAHTTVSPEEASVEAVETFTVSAPGEKDIPIIEERVEVPQGFRVLSVDSPPGWQGSLQGDSIVWSGGEIPQGEEQEFTFEAQTPAQVGEYEWKAFDTYQDGSISGWTGPEDSESPASVVEVSTAIGHGDDRDAEASNMSDSHGELPETGGISPLLYAGVAFSLVAVGLTLRSRLFRS